MTPPRNSHRRFVFLLLASLALGLLAISAVSAQAAEVEASTPAPGWSSLLPPVLAILLALAFRQVVPALLLGIWIGASLVHGGPLAGALRTIDQYLIGALADSDHASIVIFSLLLGGMVGIISRSGGTQERC